MGTSFVVALFMVVLVGWFLRSKNIVNEHAPGNLATVCSDVLVPAAVFRAMQVELTADMLGECAWLMAVSLAVLAVERLIAALFVKLGKATKEDKGIFTFCIMFSNFGFIGIPVVEGLYGDKGLFYFTVFVLLIRIVFNSYGMLIMRSDAAAAKGLRAKLKTVFNPLMIGLLLGLVYNLSGLAMPAVMYSFVDTLAKGNAPVGLLVVGMNLSGYSVKQMLNSWRVWAVAALRLLIIPVLLIFAMSPFGFERLAVQAAAAAMALPVPAMASIITRRYGGNAFLASQMVFISTALSVITLPVVLYLSSFA